MFFCCIIINHVVGGVNEQIHVYIYTCGAAHARARSSDCGTAFVLQ